MTLPQEEWDEKRIDIIGQNGNDGLHYGVHIKQSFDCKIKDCFLVKEKEMSLLDKAWDNRQQEGFKEFENMSCGDKYPTLGEYNMSGGVEEMYRELKVNKLNQEVPEWERTTQMVIEDMKRREAFGLQKYGKFLTPSTDEDMLQHLYEELMDGAVYIKTLIEQRKQYSHGGCC